VNDKTLDHARLASTATASLVNGLAFNRLLSIIGRLAICYLFCSAALFHLTFGRDITVRDMSAHHIPFAGVLNGFAMLLSGGLALALLLNFRTRWAALGLALYTLVVSFVMYGPLNADWDTTRVLFMKDMAIFGTLLAWSCSVAAQQSAAKSGAVS
jgi:putative oxidoreductase